MTDKPRPDRGILFREWLQALTPEKIDLLSRLEKTARLIAHVKELTGTDDPKLLEELRKLTHELRGAYESKAS